MWNIIFSPFKIDWSLRFFQPTIYFSIFFLSELKEEEEEKGKEERRKKGGGGGEVEEKRKGEREIAGTQNKSLIINCFPNSFRIMVASLYIWVFHQMSYSDV